jgi:hypothetical protein
MANIRFQYLYRDASNYKSWGDVIFSNAQCLAAKAIEKALRTAFLTDGLFIARQIRLPDLFLFKKYALTQDDHCFHEFYSVKATGEPVTDRFTRSVEEFVKEVEEESQRGWHTFDPLDALSESTSQSSSPCRA